MNYRIKNINYWKQICPNRMNVIGKWMNDEVHTLDGEIEREVLSWGSFADITNDISMEQEEQKREEQSKLAEMQAEIDRLKAEKENTETKEGFKCEFCGKVCKSNAGLVTHQRKCNENPANK